MGRQRFDKLFFGIDYFTTLMKLSTLRQVTVIRWIFAESLY
jgi:hypothetical protein